MVKSQKNKWMLPALLVMVGVMMAGCVGTGAPAQPQVVYPTVVIVQYVTQIVATVTPAPPVTPAPAAAVEATSAGVVGYDPASQDIYYPLMGCPVASRLHVGDQAFVANGGGQVSLYQSANIGFSPMFRKLESGEVLNVVDGPVCQRESLVWKVVTTDGQTGFAAEGNGNVYWLLPTGDRVDKKLLKATQGPALRLGAPSYCKPR